MHRFLYLSLMFFNLATANIGPEGFKAFVNDYFVETGVYGGEGVVRALQAGFKEVRTIDIEYAYVSGARNRFKNYPHVKIYHGDSARDLWKMIQDIESPITFWLDGHVYPPRADGGKNCPLVEELEQIGRHPLKNHTILIDDMICCNTAAFDFLTQEDLIQKILEINPHYQISYVNGGDRGEVLNNIMVARAFE